MSNFTNKKRGASRGRLLATASTVALIVSICGSEPALASGEPTLWFELGWGIENVRDSANDIGLPLGPLVSQTGLTEPLTDNLGFTRNYTDEGKITFQPRDSHWLFSGSIRYGRSRGQSRIAQALTPIPTTSFISYFKSVPGASYYFHATRGRKVPANGDKLSEDSSYAQSHFIIDFDAGRDVGIGLFGQDSKSVLSAGVRFAHFTMSRTASNFEETQGIYFQTSHFTYSIVVHIPHMGNQLLPFYHSREREFWNTISANGSTSQKFNGIGPSAKWEASAPLWGDSQGNFSLDWGVNAALLFGKQKKEIHHQSTSAAHCLGPYCPAHPAVYTNSGNDRTTKTITVPNVGGFAGFSLNYPNVKVSIGYRADLFVNAIDVGFATRKSSNLLFHGPFASLSIGVGD